MLYTAKCYWPDVERAELERSLTRLGASYRATLVFPDDSLVLCLFEAESAEAVKRVSEQAGMPCERVMQSVWLAPTTERSSHA